MMPSSGKLNKVYKPVSPFYSPSLQTAAQPTQQQQQDQQPTSDLSILSLPYTPLAASETVPEGAQSFATTLTSQTGLRRSAASQYGAAPTPSWMSASQSLFRSSSSAAATHAATLISRQSVSLGAGACRASSLQSQITPIQLLPLSASLVTCDSHTDWPEAYVIAPDAAARVDSSTNAQRPAATSCATLSSPGLSEADWLQEQQPEQQRQLHLQEKQPPLQQLSFSSRVSTLTRNMALGESFGSSAWVTGSVEPTAAGCGVCEYKDNATGGQIPSLRQRSK